MPTRQVIIDHLKIGVSDLDASRRFYAQALERRASAQGRSWNGKPGPLRSQST